MPICPFRRTLLVSALLAAVPFAPAQTTPPADTQTAAAVSPSFDLAGIAHVAFRVSDLQAALAFYQQLGFERAFELTTKDGKPSEEFIKINDRQYLELYPASLAPSEPLGLMHVCYEAADLNALQAAYAQAGLNPPAVRKAGAGNLLLVLRGPGNVVLEYTQYMPGSMHTRDNGQHLGPKRIATVLTSVLEPVEDPAAFVHLFTLQMKFPVRSRSQPPELVLPGGSKASISFVSSTTAPKSTLILTGASLEGAAQTLKAANIRVTRQANSLTFDDPDGNHLTLLP
jgi:catechol 2,3-dioxygenase-like lactoylglutathione lyase family enzyme